MTPRTADCSAATIDGRRRKAQQFERAAEIVALLADDAKDVADALVTLHVHAGIAAADVICCIRLGVHAQGENHNEAVKLLAQADSQLASRLDVLLKVKTKAAYSWGAVSNDDRLRAERAADQLMEAMRATS